MQEAEDALSEEMEELCAQVAAAAQAAARDRAAADAELAELRRHVAAARGREAAQVSNAEYLPLMLFSMCVHCCTAQSSVT